MLPSASCGVTCMITGVAGAVGGPDTVQFIESGKDQLSLTGLVNTSVALPEKVSDAGVK